jgi:CRP-like cAMP-binding protein
MPPQMITTFETRKGRYVVDLESTILRYVQRTFVLDLLACMPGSSLLVDLPHNRRFCTVLTKLCKTPRAYDAFGSLYSHGISKGEVYASTIRILSLISGGLFISHWLACFWWAFAEHEQSRYGSESWLAHVEALPDYTDNQFGKWTVAWVATVYTLVGEQHLQVTVREQQLTCIGMVIGACLSGIMVSKASVHLNELNAEKVIYDTKMAQVRSELRKRNLPIELRNRCTLYYDYVWNHHGVFDVHHQALGDLSPALAHEINVFTHRSMVQSIPFFRSVSAIVIHDIMAQLQQEVYLGADYIVHMGEPGRALYFITKGICSVIIERQLARRKGTVRDNTRRQSWVGTVKSDLRRVKVLTDGAYFGEMSLIDEEAMASAHVVADSVVEVQALLRKAFRELLRKHPILELAINRAIGKSQYVELDEATDEIVHRRVELQQVIVDIPLFSSCSARVIKDVVGRLQVMTFEDGEEILRKGNKARGLFIITQGQCDVLVPCVKNDDEMDDRASDRMMSERGASEAEGTIHGMKGMELVRIERLVSEHTHSPPLHDCCPAELPTPL